MNLKRNYGHTNNPSYAGLINPNVPNIFTGTTTFPKDMFKVAQTGEESVSIKVTNGNLVLNDADTTSSMLAERVINDMSLTCLPSALQTNPHNYSEQLLRRDLEFLNAKINATRKTVTAGDTYNVRGVAETPEDILNLLNTLTPNSSFIVNTTETYHNAEQEYHIGDIVFKDITNNTHIIHAQGAGLYYPSQFIQDKSTNTYQLSYTFTTTEPDKSDDEPPKLPGAEGFLGDASYNITTPVLELKAEELIYGQRGSLARNDFTKENIDLKPDTAGKDSTTKQIELKQDKAGQDIIPVVYLYTIETHERIIIDNSIEIFPNDRNKNVLQIQNMSQLPIIYEVR